MRIVVTGGRTFRDYALLESTLDQLAIDEIVQGGAYGADTLAKRYAKRRGIKCTTYEAQWDLHGKAAGFIRNRNMLQSLRVPDLVVAFPGGRGTADCIRTARKLGIEVLEVKGEET